MKTPGIIIAGATSGVGKTTISIAIMYGLMKKGYRVQPFKIGPDFIDPSYHNMITKRKSKNLDIWLMGINGILECYLESSVDSDFTVLEGVMGLFDGLSGKSNFASTAHVSKILNIPIILVIDAKKAARSLAAITLGYMKFDRSIRISGVILNNIASERHLRYINEAFESKIRVPILGRIFNNKNIKFDERHLGLVPGLELDREIQNSIIKNTSIISDCIDIEKITHIGMSRNHIGLNNKKKLLPYLNKNKSNNLENKQTEESKIKISIATDKSFNFYYQDNLNILQKNAKLEFFSPLEDYSVPPDTAGIMIGGGFPEVIADKLEKNINMRKTILRLAENNIPIYAECGGLMYLTKSISGYKNSKKKYKMVGLFDAETIMTGKLTLGYTEASVNSDKTFLGRIKTIKGHEFHYSNIILNNNDLKLIYNLKRGKGIKDGSDALFTYNCIASYMHTHFINSNLSKNFLKSCVQYSRK